MSRNGNSGSRQPAADTRALDFARSIIGRVSRTFAIGITILPGDLGKAVLTGYLLCRIADTVEDDGSSSATRRQELLAKFIACFDDPALVAGFGEEASDITVADPNYRELLRGTKLVFDVLHSLPPQSARIVA